MNMHAQIVKVHIVILSLSSSPLVSSLVCRFRCNSQVCSSVCQLKNGQVWSYRSNSVWLWLWWWFHPIEESHQSVSVSSFCILYTSSFCYIKFLLQPKLFHRIRACTKYCSLAKSARFICQKLKVSLCDDSLSEGKTIYWLQWKDVSRSV